MTIRLWRITKAAYRDTAYNGEGARLYGGRFNSPGRAVVYTSGSLALAVLEFMANLDQYDPDLLAGYVVVPAEVPAENIEARPEASMPEDWRSFPHARSTRQLGDDWLREQRTCVVAVPSAVISSERNYLINPAHPDFSSIVIGHPEPLEIDARLLK